MSAGTLVHLGCLAFFILAGYGVCGAPVQSLFLATYGSAALPWGWLAVAAASAVSVAAVSAAARRTAVLPLLQGASLISLGAFVVLLVLQHLQVPWAAFVLFVWKEVYVVVLVEMFWTLANVAFAAGAAQRTYGWFCAAGSVGGVLGNGMLPYCAQTVGTLNTLWLTVPFLLLPLLSCIPLQKALGTALSPSPQEKQDLRTGLRVLGASRYLGLMLGLVAVVQCALAVMDFQFNEVVQTTYPTLDTRTAALGWVNAFINGVSLLLQVGAGLLLRTVGVRATLLMLPASLMACVLAYTVAPGFGTMAWVKVVGKSNDYSLFRVVKEMLYIPLSYAEKTQGKALVDMLTYRAAKVGAALLLLALAGSPQPGLLNGVNLCLCGLWLGLTVLILRHYQAITR